MDSPLLPGTGAGRRLAAELGVQYRIDLIIAAEQHAAAAALAGARRGVEALAEPTYDGDTWGTYESHGWGVALVAVLALLAKEARNG